MRRPRRRRRRRRRTASPRPPRRRRNPPRPSRPPSQLHGRIRSSRDGPKTLDGLIALFGEKSFAILFVILLAYGRPWSEKLVRFSSRTPPEGLRGVTWLRVSGRIDSGCGGAEAPSGADLRGRRPGGKGRRRGSRGTRGAAARPSLRCIRRGHPPPRRLPVARPPSGDPRAHLWQPADRGDRADHPGRDLRQPEHDVPATPRDGGAGTGGGALGATGPAHPALLLDHVRWSPRVQALAYRDRALSRFRDPLGWIDQGRGLRTSELALVEEHHRAIGTSLAVCEPRALVESARGRVRFARPELHLRRAFVPRDIHRG